jgi:hypothetical protein
MQHALVPVSAYFSMRKLIAVISLDLSENDKPDAFWQGYFQALVARLSCPGTIETTVSSSVEMEEEDPVFLLTKRKYNEWIAFSGGGWAKGLFQ